MSIHIDQVLDYLDSHPVCQETDSMDSLLKSLQHIYAMHNTADSEMLQRISRSLRSNLDRLSPGDTEGLLELVNRLCREKEQLAFSQGIVVGMQLMAEVRTLP